MKYTELLAKYCNKIQAGYHCAMADGAHNASEMMHELLIDGDWLDLAACKSMKGLMYDSYHGESQPDFEAREKLAKRVCDSCVVVSECLDYALGNEEYHIWGGMTASERRNLRKQLKAS